MHIRGTSFYGHFYVSATLALLAFGQSGPAIAQSAKAPSTDQNQRTAFIPADSDIYDGDWIMGIAHDGPPRAAQKPKKTIHAAPAAPPVQYSSAPNGPNPASGLADVSDNEPRIFVGSISVNGSENLGTSDFGKIIESHVGQELREEELRKLSQEIAQSARGEGYIFANARIPKQPVTMGVLKIELDEGRLDEVRIIGSDNKTLHRLLNKLLEEKPTKKNIENKLVLAGDIPKITVRKTRFLKDNGRNILEVTVSERKNHFTASVDNYGSKSIGPIRFKLGFDYEGLLTDRDQGSVNIRTNPVDPEEFVYASANYSTGVNDKGTRIGIAASAGKTEPGNRSAGASDLQGDSRYLSILASHPIKRSNSSSLWINANMAYLSIEQDIADTLISDDTQVTFSVGLSANNKLLGGRLRVGGKITQGLGILGTTRLGDPLSSRFDGDGVFTKGTLYANWRGPISGNLGLLLGAYGQVANRPLLSSQEFSIGGAYSARGFNFSEVSGENGVSAIAELNYTFKKPAKWIDRLQPYIFIDGGYADNIDNGYGSGSLLSTGLGLRANMGKFNFEIEGAAPLNRIRDESGDKSPQINMTLGLQL